MSDGIRIGDVLYGKLGFRDKDPFAARPIIAETKMSWLVQAYPGSPGDTQTFKVNKKTMLEAVSKDYPRRWYTKEALDDHLFVVRNRWRIERAVGACNAAQLRQIAKIIGYKADET